MNTYDLEEKLLFLTLVVALTMMMLGLMVMSTYLYTENKIQCYTHYNGTGIVNGIQKC